MILEPRLWDIARAVRSFLEPIWPEWHRDRGRKPDVPSRGTCGRSSLFLQHVLRHDCRLSADWTTGVPIESQQGPKDPGLGIFTGHDWHAHSWVEVEGGWVVDITADQFLLPAIIVTPIADARYRKGPIDPAGSDFRKARIAAAAALWPLWEASQERAKLLAALDRDSANLA